MKWAFVVQRKIRLAIFMAVLMLCILIFSLLESYNVTQISKSFNSIYQDRLIPATDLYHISEHIQNRKYQIALFLYSENNDLDKLQGFLKQSDGHLGRAIEKYEKTYLVKAEIKYLSVLKKAIESYRKEEALLITISQKDIEQSKKLFLNKTSPLLDTISAQLRNLIDLQTIVGQELVNKSYVGKFNSDIITNLQMISSIILGLMIIVLVKTDRAVSVKQDKYKLN